MTKEKLNNISEISVEDERFMFTKKYLEEKMKEKIVPVMIKPVLEQTKSIIMLIKREYNTHTNPEILFVLKELILKIEGK